jgi:pimeloyl-ACP methyl ester carboxylesterase
VNRNARAGVDGTIRLADERTLGYREWNPDGVPVFGLHGSGGSRLLNFGDDLPWDLGVRLVMPDRPGYGLSDLHPGQTHLDWANDAAQLADALGVDRFAVFGVSGGGPGAAASGFAMPDRVTAVGLVGAVGPYRDDPEMRRDVTGQWRQELMSLGISDPAAAESLIRQQCEENLQAMEKDIEASVDEWPDDAPESDRALFRDREDLRAMYLENSRELVRRGPEGLAQDLLLNYTGRWKFRPEEILVPAFVWHGELDNQVPVTVARRMGERIPDCSLTIYPNEGHMVDAAHGEEILQALAFPPTVSG